MLVSLAHPDDEAFGNGPALARYAAEGVEITLICATNGDVGTVDEKLLEGYGSIMERRRAELDCSAQALGLKEVILFGYRDSGMMGSADNHHPESLWQAPLDAVKERVIEVIRRTRPQIILTFDPYGAYGHPDHIKIHQATLAAFHALQAEPDRPQKIYYGTVPRNMIRLWLWQMKLRGQDPRKFGRNKDLDLQAVYDALLPVTTRIDVRPYIDAGLKAMACHASQIEPESGNPVIRFVMRRVLSSTSLVRAFPERKPGEAIERDLFSGVKLS